MSKKILFFIEGLWKGGKERRLVELLIYLKQHTDFQIKLVLTEHEIHYNYIQDLDIPIEIIKRFYFKKEPSLFFRFYKIAKEFQPDIIHTWGFMTTVFAIPTKYILKKPLLANLIANAKDEAKPLSLARLFQSISFKFSDIILGNSNAGFKAYGLENNTKKHLIYNGVRLERFNINIDKDQLKKDLKITAPFVLTMVASTSIKKDYDLLLDVAKKISKLRNDILFLGIGGGSEYDRLQTRVTDENIHNIKLLGKQDDVEKLISIADVALLFTPCEGLSNAIIEYMALRKPVITTDLQGGSREIITNEESGYLLESNVDTLTEKIIELLDNPELRKQLGTEGRAIIEKRFSVERMGKEYVELYESI